MRLHVIHLTTLLLLSFILSACSGSTPSTTPTGAPLGPTPTLDPTLAPSFAEIEETVAKIWSEDRDKDKDVRYDRMISYYKSLVGKRVENWHAWVYHRIENYDGTTELWPIWQDPYTSKTERRDDGCKLNCGDAHFNLVGLTHEQLQLSRIGEEIVFSGVLVPTRNYAAIKVERLEIAPPTAPTPTLLEQLDDFEVGIERTICYGTCPVYRLTITGDGTVVYEGEMFVDVTGKQTYNIGPEKVRELAMWVLKVGYFDLRNYTRGDVTDAPSAYTSVTLDGKTKKISHYHGDSSSPSRLTIFEAKIDEIANSAQWIGNGGRNPSKGPTMPLSTPSIEAQPTSIVPTPEPTAEPTD